MPGAEFPWAAIATVIVGLTALGGVVFASRGNRATSRAEHQQKDYTDMRNERDDERRGRKRAENYAEVLREQITVELKGTPKPWPPEKDE